MVLFLCFIGSFAFFTCKKDTNNISNQHTTKTNIAIYKSLRKGKDIYIYKYYLNFKNYLYSKPQNWERPSAETLPKLTKIAQNKRNHCLICIYIDKLCMLKTLYLPNKLLQEMLRCQNQPISHFSPKWQFDQFCTPWSPPPNHATYSFVELVLSEIIFPHRVQWNWSPHSVCRALILQVSPFWSASFLCPIRIFVRKDKYDSF